MPRRTTATPPQVTPGHDAALDGHDPVLDELHKAEQVYAEVRMRELAELRARSEELQKTRTELEAARQLLALAERDAESARSRADALTIETEELRTRERENRERLEQQRVRAEQNAARARGLAEALKKIHRALFQGNVYDLILRACITLTGGTRGVYITASTEAPVGNTTPNSPARLKVVSAIDVEIPANTAPPPWLAALATKVLDDGSPIVKDRQQPYISGLPEPTTPEEHFSSFLAAPVTLLTHLSGVIIVADKPDDDFDEDDQELILSVGHQSAVAVENRRLERQLQEAYLATISALADTMEAKDPYTFGHCEEVARYARLTAERLGLEERERSIVCYAAMLHDIGKIAVSDGVLNKPGPLLPEERVLVQAHVRVGHDLVSRVQALRVVSEAVLHHHEAYDGSGYPQGLSGQQIPLPARIVGVVDAYSAMVSKRSYKDSFPPERAREELLRCAGSQFDPRVVQAFLEIIDTPRATDIDFDTAAECGPLPGFDGLIRSRLIADSDPLR